MSRNSCHGCCAATAILPMLGIVLLLLVVRGIDHDVRHFDPFTKGAYVSGRPDLTYNADAEDIRQVNQKLAAFFQAHELSVTDARDLRIATGVHYKYGVLFNFVMAPEKQQKLLRGKRRLRISAASVLARRPGPAPQVRAMIPPDTDEQAARGALSYLAEESPFNRLEWWPPPERQLRTMQVYRGPLRWHQPEVPPNTCYLFVTPGSDSVSVASGS